MKEKINALLKVVKVKAYSFLKITAIFIVILGCVLFVAKKKVYEQRAQDATCNTLDSFKNLENNCSSAENYNNLVNPKNTDAATKKLFAESMQYEIQNIEYSKSTNTYVVTVSVLNIDDRQLEENNISLKELTKEAKKASNNEIREMVKNLPMTEYEIPVNVKFDGTNATVKVDDRLIETVYGGVAPEMVK